MIPDNEYNNILNTIIISISEIYNRLSTELDIETFSSFSKNSFNDDVKYIDTIANDLFINNLMNNNLIAGVASEELENPIIWNDNGKYICIIDPIDGSSNVDIGITVGSIFSILKYDPTLKEKSFLQPGNNIIMAGYTLYGPNTSLVLAYNNKVNEYKVINKSLHLYRENIKCPINGGVFSMNSSKVFDWFTYIPDWYKNNVSELTFRYVGSLVAEAHRTLIKGGFYGYPSDIENINGKLRLLYECAPIAFVFNCAGGKATSGYKNILNIIPTSFDQRCPLFIGSSEIISDFLSFKQEYPFSYDT